MNAMPAASVEALLPILTRDVIDTIADRPNETVARRQERANGAMRMIEAFHPETGVEIILAGQSVLLQNLLLDTIHDTHRATTPDNAFRGRQQALSFGRLQLSYLKEIRRHSAEHAPPLEAEPPAEIAAAPEPPTAVPAQIHAQIRPAPPSASPPPIATRPMPVPLSAPAPAMTGT